MDTARLLGSQHGLFLVGRISTIFSLVSQGSSMGFLVSDTLLYAACSDNRVHDSRTPPAAATAPVTHYSTCPACILEIKRTRATGDICCPGGTAGRTSPVSSVSLNPVSHQVAIWEILACRGRISYHDIGLSFTILSGISY